MSAFAPAVTPHAVDGGLPGLLRFARYAYGPNALGYCGPDAADELREFARTGQIDPRLRELAAAFEGAYPFLEQIARANALPDPLGSDVVEAYWLGNELVEAARLADGHRPVHAFHVIEVLSRAGLRGAPALGELLTVIDACRVRWGTVEERDGARLVVSAAPLQLRDRRLALGASRRETVECWPDGSGEAVPLPGDVVSLHWGWACERLSERQLAALRRHTQAEVEIANRAL